MRKFFYPIILLCALAATTSCFKESPVKLDEQEWDVVSYEDLFDGYSVSGDNIVGTMYSKNEGNGTTLYLTIPDFGYNNDLIGPDDYTVVKHTSSELIVDLWYYEYPDLRVSDCTYVETFMGKKIYSFPDPEDNNYNYYVYFNSRGKAVDLGVVEVSSSEYYFYDKTRIKFQVSW